MEPIYHFISHSHWDREWYKTFETFRLDLADLIHSLLHIFKTNPDYKYFTLDGQTVILEDYADIFPEKTEELKKYIRAGKISVGPWYVLPDEFLVSGESTIRNLLFGQKVAQKFDGSAMQVGYIPDSFGHTAMMPAILRGFDMDTAIVYRGFGGEPGQEKSEYIWQAADGSEVLMIHLPPNGYGDAYIGENSTEAFIKKGNRLKEILDPRATTPHRLCMNGGDHHFPEPYLPQALQIMSHNCGGQFIHSNLSAYVAAVKRYLKQNPTPLTHVAGELKWGYRYAFVVNSGVYSSRIYLKQANYQCEKLLTRYVEPLAAWATLAGREHLFPMIEESRKLLLQNHPHDSICGCSIDEVHREMETRFDKCRQISEAVIEKSFRHFYPDSFTGAENVFIFNPQTREVDHPVEAAVEFFRQKTVVGLNPDIKTEAKPPLISGFKITDTNGHEIPYQILNHEPETYGLRYSDYSYPTKNMVERFTLLLDVKQIPGLGLVRLKTEPADTFPEYASKLKTGGNFIENDYLKIEAAPNGSINVTEKINGQLFSGFHTFEDGGDAGDEYNYSYPREDQIITTADGNAKINLVETGPLRAALRIGLKLRLPKSLTKNRKKRRRETATVPITSTIFLYSDQPRIEFETEIDNIVKDHRLRVLFPSGFRTNVSFADSQFCITKREHQAVNPADFKIEVPSSVHPMQRGVTILDGDSGLTVATEGLPEYELKTDRSGTLAITLLRCVGRLSGGDLLTRPGGDAGWITEAEEAQCQGKHTFRYAVIPHSVQAFREYTPVNTQLEAFHLPCRAVRRSGEPAINWDSCGISLSPAALVFSAFKQAEDKNGAIFRCYNPTAKSVNGILQTKTELTSAALTRLNETDEKEIPVENGNKIRFIAAANQIISIRLNFGQKR